MFDFLIHGMASERPGPRNMRKLCWAGPLFIGMGVSSHIVGVVTPSWGRIYLNVYMTLWEICSRGRCMHYPSKPGFVIACELLAMLGVVTGLAAVFSSFLHVTLPRTTREGVPWLTSKFIYLTCSLSCVFIVMCAAIWYVSTSEDFNPVPNEDHRYVPGYSQVLSACGAPLILVGVACMLLAPGPPSRV